MGSQRIRINTATAEELEQLYDIGPDSAQRIISYRAAHGPFRSPVDLARVEGVSSELADVLAPHIDWHVSEEPEPLTERSWFRAIVVVALYVPILYWLTNLLGTRWGAELSVTGQGNAAPWSWVTKWILFSMSAGGFFLTLFALALVGWALMRHPRWAS